ncbi:alginate lyase 2 [Lentinula aciculospora]|uniref:Alginate lyase 2 n=1 Tax=Lentinula aciculospora TaxID=153920 RepID=A0A9W9DV09_9AGAR|nr:alginate lyase 2 [Lentinula aciculospora]
MVLESTVVRTCICQALCPAFILALDKSVSPGGNFDFSIWELQLCTGSPGSPDTKSSSSLEGDFGYEDDAHFYTSNTDGALVMKVPGSPSSSGCVTTKNSEHCRTELRELGSWDPSEGVNKMVVQVAVVKADDSEHGTVIGQIHIDDSVSTKPVIELYYNSQGTISTGVEQTLSGGNEKLTTFETTISLNTQFTYEIDYSGGSLKVTVNGEEMTPDTYELDNPKSYFKAGNYNQGSSASEVHFYSIDVQH